MNDSVPIFKNGKLEPGIYKIQNIVGQTYLDMREHTRELCCRPATLLDGKGLWDIRPSGFGYTIRRIDPGNPEQFCIVLGAPGCCVSVAPFPVAWRMDVIHDGRYPGCEYVRFFWGTTNNTWDLAGGGSEKDLTPVHLLDNRDANACRIWKLIPVKLDAIGSAPEASSVPHPGFGPLPQYDGNPCDQRCAYTRQYTEANGDGEYEMTIVESTVTTTTTKTVTMRKKHSAEGE